jgi:hypothetical protein
MRRSFSSKKLLSFSHLLCSVSSSDCR